MHCGTWTGVFYSTVSLWCVVVGMWHTVSGVRAVLWCSVVWCVYTVWYGVA